MYVCRENQKKRAKDKTDEQPFLKIQKGEKEQQYATKRQRENHLTNFWKEPKSMYVCRQTNTNKTKSQNKLAAVPENSRAGGRGNLEEQRHYATTRRRRVTERESPHEFLFLSLQGMTARHGAFGIMKHVSIFDTFFRSSWWWWWRWRWLCSTPLPCHHHDDGILLFSKTTSSILTKAKT